MYHDLWVRTFIIIFQRLIEVLEACIDKNISLFCIISSNVTLLVTELLGQFQDFLNTPRNN